jgi:hypothetical protein
VLERHVSVKQLQYNQLYQQDAAQANQQEKLLKDTKEKHHREIERMKNNVNKIETATRLESLFDGCAPGRGKWRNIAMELINLAVLKDSLIDQSMSHIKNNVYTKMYWAYTVDMYHVIKLSGIDDLRKIEATINGRGLIWSSRSVNRVHHHIETEMQKQIKFEIIKDRDGETTVDGIKFKIRSLFAYLLKAFFLDDDVKRHNMRNSIRTRTM